MNKLEQEKKYKENLEKKIINTIARIKEIEEKEAKLHAAKIQLMADLQKNKRKLEEGLPSPKPKTQVSEADINKYLGAGSQATTSKAFNEPLDESLYS